jgi:glutathione S-transferase
MSKLLLVIGNKNYSSWSLRAWLALRKSGAAFDERRLALDTPEFYEEIADLSPTRRVPVLWHDAQCIWDSLAIAEYVNEQFAGGSLWPADSRQRALARAVSAEMHAGFNALRQQLPMNCRAHNRAVELDRALEEDIGRILSIWTDCRRARSDAGDWLFGRFSIADAMFAPVAIRLHAYDVNLPELARDYVAAVLKDTDVAEWMESGAVEPEVIAADEAGVEQNQGSSTAQ